MDMEAYYGDTYNHSDIIDHETEEERIESYYQKVTRKAIKSDHPGVKEKLEELIVITELVHGHESEKF